MIHTPADRVKILMYHSISSALGLTNIPPSTFWQQLEIFEDWGYTPVFLAEVTAWHCGELRLDGR